jgi:hypothetical protein
MNLRSEGNIMNDLNNSRNLAARPRAASSLWLLSLMVCCAAAPITTRAATLYVWQDSPSPVPPYTSWATAATNIQDAVDAAQEGDLALVTNGAYASVWVSTALTLQSVNGPGVTLINALINGGDGGCVYLTNGAVLAGFTLTNGVAEAGGGVYCEASAVVSNCILSGNVSDGASFGFYSGGGGAYGGTLDNCTLSGNSTFGGSAWDGNGGGAWQSTLNNCTLTGNMVQDSTDGGGAYECLLNNCTLTSNSVFQLELGEGGGASLCTLNNCTLTGNSAYSGGGAYACTLNNCTLTGNSDYYVSGGGAYASTLNNCIVYFNPDSNPNGGNYDAFCTLNYCCTTPMPTPTNGIGDITNDPAFVDYAGGNLRLQSNSPCINSGNNAYVVGATDLDGNPRIVGGTVDIGAYEYQTPTSIISYAWLQQYGLPTDGSVDHADLDGTGMNVYQDWIAGLNPTNALSVLQMTSATPTNSQAGLVVTWESVSGIMYFLQSSTNLAAQPAFTTMQSNIVGQAGTTSYTDTNALGSGPFFYRVGVRH